MEEKRSSGSDEEGTAENQEEVLGVKLKKRGVLGVGRKAGPCTPSTTWKLSSSPSPSSSSEKSKKKKKTSAQVRNFTIKASLTLPTTVSARTLGANLWEVEQFSLVKMRRGGSKHPHQREKDLEMPTHSMDPSPAPTIQPANASGLRRNVEAKLARYHQSVANDGVALQPASPASYSSSVEGATYNPPITPTSSLELKKRVGESGYSVKTSTELLKVLNRIWSLEEQHASNLSLVKGLTMELDHSRAKIRELVKEQPADRHRMDDLLQLRKSKEKECIEAAFQSVRDEVEDERKLRKRSESLQRKLARELSEVKSAFSMALKELERERKAQGLLEELCDEFARGIGEYEQEVRFLKHKSGSETSCREDHEKLILHISEAWLDERLQMKLADTQSDLVQRNTIVEKLRFEIEAFLQSKRSISSKHNDIFLPKNAKSDSVLRRESQESVLFHEAASAPRHVGDEEDSSGSDSNYFEIHKGRDDVEIKGSRPHRVEGLEGNHVQTKKANPTKKKLEARERNITCNTSTLQLQFAEQMTLAMSSSGSKNQILEKDDNNVRTEGTKSVEPTNLQKSGDCEVTQERKGKRDGTQGSSSNHVMDSLIRSQTLSSDGKKLLSKNMGRENSRADSAWRGHASPVQQWRSRFASPDTEISEPSSKRAMDSNDNTLKSKLLEARLEGRHSRLKASKGS